MSKRIVSTILVSSVASCLLLAPVAFSAHKSSLDEAITTAKIKSSVTTSYISKYKSYPAPRRSALTLHMQNVVARLD